MPTPSSGPISFANLQTTFGVTPTPINQLYRAGANVPDITNNNAIPTSGIVSLNEYYSTWGNKTLTFTVTIGSKAGGKKGTLFGFGSGYGSTDTPTFLTPNGIMTIAGLYYSTANSNWHLQLSSTSAPNDADLSFKQVSVTGYSIGGLRSARTNTTVSGNTRQWAWHVTNTAHPTSGTVTCSIQYYG